MLLKLSQASLTVLEKGFECQLRDCEEKLKSCFRIIWDFVDWHIPLLLQVTQS